MSDPTPDTKPVQVSQEFFIRVNDFIQMANRIEKRYDSHHAQLAMLHAFCRYSAHHYRNTATTDDAEHRDAFADYMSAAVKSLVIQHLKDVAGPLGAATPAGEPEGDGQSDAE